MVGVIVESQFATKMRSRVTAVPLALSDLLVLRGGRLVGVRRLESSAVERRAHVVAGVELIVELAEGDVLMRGAWKGAELRGDESHSPRRTWRPESPPGRAAGR